MEDGDRVFMINSAGVISPNFCDASPPPRGITPISIPGIGFATFGMVRRERQALLKMGCVKMKIEAFLIKKQT